MVFSSLSFLFLFLPFVNLTYFACLKKIRLQNLMLMLFSLFFYYWGEKNYILIMMVCIFINYLCGIFIEDTENPLARKLYLIASIVVSISLLFFFKYFNFLLHSIEHFFNLGIDPSYNIALPLGISFYTFHALSYTIDVYWKKASAERNFIIFVCYVSFFPQLVAGPIVRYRDIAHSFYSRYITRAGFRNGILRFCFGLGKKVLIANEVAKIADYAFSLPQTELTFVIAWFGAVAYTLQIYFDFSGYSDMAIGLGLLFGFKYKENFRFPYESLSIQEFWRKWHISLASWFRDYIYIPLGGSRGSSVRTWANLIIIFGLCGLWHGANYTFVIWGLFHGFFLILERTRFGALMQRLPLLMRHFYVLLVVTTGWVFFREEHLKDAVFYLKTMMIPEDLGLHELPKHLNYLGILAMALGIILSLGANRRVRDYLITRYDRALITTYKQLTIIAGLVVLLVSILFLSPNSHNPFLYFRF